MLRNLCARVVMQQYQRYGLGAAGYHKNVSTLRKIGYHIYCKYDSNTLNCYTCIFENVVTTFSSNNNIAISYQFTYFVMLTYNVTKYHILVRIFCDWYWYKFTVGEGEACCHNFQFIRCRTGYDWAIKTNKTGL